MDVVAMVLMGTLAGVLAPEGKGDIYRRLLRMTAGLALILVMAETVYDGVQGIRQFCRSIEETLAVPWEEGVAIQREAESWVMERGIRNVEEGAASLVKARFGADVAVTADSTVDADGTVTIVSLQIVPEPDCKADPQEMAAYLENLLSCPCRIAGSEENA